MITCKNIIRLPGLDFESYKLLPQYNFSYLKSERAGIAKPVTETPKIILGKLVDDILTDGKPDMLHKLYPHAKKIAAFLDEKFGHVLPFLAKQVSFTGELYYNGFVLPVKGRPDFELLKSLIIDLKVTSARNYQGVIDYMRYNDQQWLYAKLAQAKESYLLPYSIPLQQADFIPVPLPDYNEFWADKIIKFGKPL